MRKFPDYLFIWVGFFNVLGGLVIATKEETRVHPDHGGALLWLLAATSWALITLVKLEEKR